MHYKCLVSGNNSAFFWQVSCHSEEDDDIYPLNI